MSNEVNAVPDHGEKLNSLDYNLCPYIQSMGAAGIELAEKIIAAEQAAEQNTQGPSVLELMEARKQRKAEGAKLNTDVPEMKPTEGKSIIPEKIVINDFKAIEDMRYFTEIEEVIKSAVIEPSLEKQIKPVSELEPPKTEITQVAKDVSVLKIKHEQPVSIVEREEVIATDEVLVKNIDYKVEKVEVELTEVVPVEVVPQIQVEAIAIEEQVIESADVVLDQSIEEFSDFLSDIRHELGLEVVDEVPVEVVEIIELDSEGFEAPMLDITEVSGADLLEELDEPVSEVAATFESDLSQLIEVLEPEKAEEVIDTLQLLVKAIRHETTETDQPELAIEELFAHLLELLDLEDQDELVMKLRIMLQLPELIDKTLTDQNLTIDQLNRLGTHEYKPTTLVSIFTSLISHVKEIISSQLMLGKYAIRGSLT